MRQRLLQHQPDAAIALGVLIVFVFVPTFIVTVHVAVTTTSSTDSITNHFFLPFISCTIKSIFEVGP